jgi:predicted lipoprotein with Yx(FWY)xxD motif
MLQLTSRARAGTLAVTSLALVLAACGAGSTPAPTAQPTTAATATPGATATSGSSQAADTGVATGNTSLGTVLVGGNGHTLYTFDSDTTPGQSACTSSGCVGLWPPLVVAGTPKAGTGVTGTLTTFDRGGGQMQVAYNGKPLYYYTPDTAPGDTKGDGVGGKWHIAKP